MFVAETLPDVLLRGLLLTAVALVWVVILVRVVGLRSFSKMTNFDFVVTLAVASALAGAGQATSWTGFGQAMIVIAALLLVQFAVARARRSSERFEAVVDNDPVLLMENGKILYDALKATRVAESDVIAKLREANALEMSKVRAVVLETTGDISVLHGDTLEPAILQGVKRANGGDASS